MKRTTTIAVVVAFAAACSGSATGSRSEPQLSRSSTAGVQAPRLPGLGRMPNALIVGTIVPTIRTVQIGRPDTGTLDEAVSRPPQWFALLHVRHADRFFASLDDAASRHGLSNANVADCDGETCARVWWSASATMTAVWPSSCSSCDGAAYFGITWMRPILPPTAGITRRPVKFSASVPGPSSPHPGILWSDAPEDVVPASLLPARLGVITGNPTQIWDQWARAPVGDGAQSLEARVWGIRVRSLSYSGFDYSTTVTVTTDAHRSAILFEPSQ